MYISTIPWSALVNIWLWLYAQVKVNAFALRSLKLSLFYIISYLIFFNVFAAFSSQLKLESILKPIYSTVTLLIAMTLKSILRAFRPIAGEWI